MGWLDFLPWAGKKDGESKTFRKLKRLQNELQDLTKKRLNISENKKLVLRRLTVSTISLTVLYLCTAYLVPYYTDGFGKESWYEWSLLMTPSLLIPFLGFMCHKFVDKLYDWRLSRWMKKIKFKKQKKDDILKKVEELETYANAVKIFKEFDRNRLKNLEKISPQKDNTIVTETITTYTEKRIPKNKPRKQPPKPDPQNSASIFTSFNHPHSTLRYRGRSLDKKKEKPKFVVPAVPSLDANALKQATKRQGLHSRSPAKSRTSSVDRPVLAITNEEDPKSKEIRELREALRAQQLKSQELENAVADKEQKLQAIEVEKSNKISIQGKLIKDRSSSNTTTSRVELIKQNKRQRAREIKIQQSQSMLTLNTTGLEEVAKLNESTPEMNSALPSSQESLNVNASHNNLSALKETLSSSRASLTDDDSGAQISDDDEKS